MYHMYSEVFRLSNRKKNRMISMRVTEDQYNYLEEMARRIRMKTGFRITRASIMLKLMEYGKPLLENDFRAEEEPKKKRLFG